MIKRIYQFADVPLTIGNQAIFTPQDTTWAGDIGTYTHSYKRFANSHRFIHQPTVLTLEGELLYDGNLLPAKIEQKLRSYIGITDTLIIYTLPNDYPPQFDLCKPCETCIDCEVVWLSAPAVLTSVSVSGDPDDGFKINLQFTLMDFFYPLNKLVWQYNGNYVQDYDSRELPTAVADIRSVLNCYPRCNDLFTDCISCRFFARRNYNTFHSVYNPNTWEAFATDNCCDYKYMYAQNFQPMPAYDRTIYRLVDNTPFGVKQFVTSDLFKIDSSEWGALPSSIYAFRFPNTGVQARLYPMGTDILDIRIIVEYNFGTVTKTETTIIQIPEMAKLTEILYVGNVSYHQNGEIFRPALVYNTTGGAAIPLLHPTVTYPSFSPGQLYPSRNKVTIKVGNAQFITSGAGTEPHPSWSQQTVDFAYIHLFRRV